jgi:predicted DNA-binding transcriptional regulator AlpA
MSATAEIQAPSVSPGRIPLAAALYDVHDIAARLKISSRQVWRLRDAGLMPNSISVGSLKRWRRAEIDEWIAAGCPRPKR